MSAPGTLLLRLAGPMQSWGTQSRFTIRDTDREPSKSGVVGLLCAALGKPRMEPVDELARLRMGVRVDHEGALKLDFQTAGGTQRRGESYGVATIHGRSARTVVSRRYYLADADFLVGLEGDAELISSLHQALAAPVWQLFLGRKAFVPGVPVFVPDGLQAGMDLQTALRTYAWPRPDVDLPPPGRRPAHLRLIMESQAATTGEARYDQPIGAAFRDRSFTLRHVATDFVELGSPAGVPIREV